MNRAILDVHLFYLRDERIKKIYSSDSQMIRDLTAEVTQDAEFVSAVETTTKSIPNVVSRLAIWGNRLERATNLKLKKPTISSGNIILI